MSNSAMAAILIPLDITAAMIDAGTSVPAVDSAAGEVAWVAGAHASGATKVNHQGWLYTAIAAPASVEPGTDPTIWRRTGPSNRMAPFDEQTNTAASATESITYVLNPGFFTGLALYGLVGEQISMTLYDKSGGEVIDSYTGELWEQPLGLFEYLYMPLRQINQKMWLDWPMVNDAQLRIRITASNGGRCAIGMITLGFWETLLGAKPEFGGVEYDAESEIKSHTSIEENEDGSWEYVPRGGVSNNISCTVVVDAEEANAAHELLQRVSGKPVAFIASGLPRYDYLNTFSILSARVSPMNYGMAQLRITGRGSI